MPENDPGRAWDLARTLGERVSEYVQLLLVIERLVSSGGRADPVQEKARVRGLDFSRRISMVFCQSEETVENPRHLAGLLSLLHTTDQFN